MNRVSRILLVEDDLDDFELTRQGFLRSHHDVQLHHVTNGQLCMDYLMKVGAYADAATPDLILLDLNMPVMDGRAVLLEISRCEQLKHLPVIVLTTSRAQTDVLYSYAMGCNSFIVKPVDFDDFQRTVNAICHYWFETVTLPPNF
jgi:two-component system, chemotaxis family, response regulator Rcp1